MVAAEQGHVGRPPGLEQHEQRKGLQAVVASIYKIPHEDIVCCRDLPSRLKELEEVMKLPVNIPAHLQHTSVLELALHQNITSRNLC